MHGSKRLRRIVPLITAAALSASLIAAAGPASVAVREPTRTTPNSLANGLPVTSLRTAAHYVHPGDGRFTLDTTKAGVSSQALSTENAIVASMNNLLDREPATATSARGDVVVNVAHAVPAANPDTTITVVPGITLTINNTGIQLNLTKEAVTEVENLAGFGQSVASLVGSILAVAQVPDGPQIASIVAAALGVGSSFLKLCTAPDGSATFTVPFPWLGLPSCSGLSLVA
jgi:hypothetical protein